ncbi:drug/metabolite transporter (DMT)-like permease [Paenibacillus castaneae]|uniref:hypothetical protein n=1 Tax=Paenibacillus castaneae TaxID=474957 RepID=UPI000C9A8C77|nr:hypothetical protein [Paenibacillus castaneae]NIK80293.1 drug/metabolite transporter (DMT)-like permease [Paenibacillus castaneae]
MVYVYSFACLIGGLTIINAAFSYQSKHIDLAFWSMFKFQLITLPLFLTANMLIGYGVKLGYKALGNLTYVLSTSKGLEIFISIAMGFLFMKEIPSWKTWVGLCIVLVGFVIAKYK